MTSTIGSGSEYVRLHPEIFEYSERWVDPLLVEGDLSRVLDEQAEQLYMFKLFSEEFCRLLIEEAEHCGRWKTGVDVEQNPYADMDDVCEPDTTQHLKHMPGLEKVYEEVVRRHLKPLMEAKWVTFKLQKVSKPYILKYSPDAVKEMKLHHDLETVTLVVYLNTDFEGGGTRFPRWSYFTNANGKPAPGSAIIYPGGLSHEHEGVAITSGKRYLMCGSFY